MHETTKRLLWAIDNYHETASSMELVGMARRAWRRAGCPDLGELDDQAIAAAIRDEDDRHEVEVEVKRREASARRAGS